MSTSFNTDLIIKIRRDNFAYLYTQDEKLFKLLVKSFIRKDKQYNNYYNYIIFLFHFFPKKGIILPYDKFLDVNLQQVGDFQYGGQVGLR